MSLEQQPAIGDVQKVVDYIETVFRTVLNRPPTLAEAEQYTNAMYQGLSAMDFFYAVHGSDERKTHAKLFAVPGSYQSPIANPVELGGYVAGLPNVGPHITGISVDRAAMIALWDELAPLLASCPLPHAQTPGFYYYFDNPFYGFGDAMMLQAMIRHHRPKRYIEIGSGFSSACAVDTVDRFLGGACELTFIEPFPERLLGVLGQRARSTRIANVPVQVVPPSIFEELEAGDLLFIDSSHVLRTANDVCVELFEILPRLKPGVVVHIHDILWPFEYPASWIVEQNRSYNEAYAVRAFLTQNASWTIRFFNDYFAKFEAGRIHSIFPQAGPDFGGSLLARTVLTRRALALAAIAVLLLCGRGVSSGASGPPIEINAILPMTGVGAFYGKSQAETFGVVETVVNDAGGINGRPIKFVVSDDQTNAQTALSLANQIVAKNVPVIMGPSYTANCLSVAPLVAKNGPVMYCLTPGIHPVRGGYVFTIANTFYDTANVTLRYFHKRGWSKIGLLTTIDAGGQEAERAFTAGAEHAKMQIVANVHFNPSDVSAGAQIARIAAAKPDVVIAWAVGTPLGTVLRNMHDGGLDVPTVTSPANVSYDQMKQYRTFLPTELFFPGYRPVTETGTAPGPLHDRLAVYFAAMKKAGLRHDLVHILNWDAAMLVVDALRHGGPAPTASGVRDYIMNLHGWAGILAMYDFGDPEQRGIGENAIVMDRWDPAKDDFVSISKAAGY